MARLVVIDSSEKFTSSELGLKYYYGDQRLMRLVRCGPLHRFWFEDKERA